MDLITLVMSPVAFVSQYPWLALVIGAAFGLSRFAIGKGGRIVAVTAILWIAYGLWEYFVKLTTPEANIRVDLLIIAPLLLVMSIWSIIAIFRGVHSNG